ncbi:MAG: ribosome maturation factor RimM [Corynebacteriales bacterium]|nr:ribosome maturation factor RimM [Mycobacteriales bacterium]
MDLIVGRIGKPHGLRGEVSVQVRTDAPDERFAPGASLRTDPAERGPLTVEYARWHSGRLLVAFTEALSREAAEDLRGTLLVVDSDELDPLPDPDEYYDHQLRGLKAHTKDGTDLGIITDVIHGPAGELLDVKTPDGGSLLIPFVVEIVPEVDIAAGHVVVVPPDGLLEL